MHTPCTRTKAGSTTGTLFLIMFYSIDCHLIGLLMYHPEKMNTKAFWKDFKIPGQNFQSSCDQKGVEKACSPTT